MRRAVLPCLATGALVLDVSSLSKQQFNNSGREGVSVSEAYILVKHFHEVRWSHTVTNAIVYATVYRVL